MDIHGTSIGHPTLTDQACPTVLSSPPVQWTSHRRIMGYWLNTYSLFFLTLPNLDFITAHSSTNGQCYPPILGPALTTGPTLLSCPVHLHGMSMGCAWDVHEMLSCQMDILTIILCVAKVLIQCNKCFCLKNLHCSKFYCSKQVHIIY